MKKVNLKSVILVTSLALTFASYGCESKNEMKIIEEMNNNEVSEAQKVLINYLKAGDESNVKVLNELTHTYYRVIFKDVSKNEVSEISRDSYLDLIEKKVFGGKPRAVEILNSDITEDHIARFKVKTSSDAGEFVSDFTLVKEQNKWYVLQDLIFMKKN